MAAELEEAMEKKEAMELTEYRQQGSLLLLDMAAKVLELKGDSVYLFDADSK